MWTSLPTGDFFSSDNQQHRLTAGTAFCSLSCHIGDQPEIFSGISARPRESDSQPCKPGNYQPE